MDTTLYLVLGSIIGVGAVAFLVRRGHSAAWNSAAERLRLSTGRSGRWGKLLMRGKYKGYTVGIDTVQRGAGASHQTVTRLKMHFEGIGTGYALTKQGPYSQVANFLGRQDHELGDKDFDDNVIVRSPDPERLAEHLTPRRRILIQRLFSRNADSVLRDGEIEMSIPGLETSPIKLRSFLDQMVRVARGLSTDEGSVVSELDAALTAQREGDLGVALDRLRNARGAQVASFEVVEPKAPDPLDEESEAQAEQAAFTHKHDVEPAPGPELGQDYEPAGPVPEIDVLEGEILLAAGKKDEARDAFERARAELPDDQELEQLTGMTTGRPAPAVPNAPLLPFDVRSVCEDLFSERQLSSESARKFEERYQGHGIRWSGTLERVSTYYSDMVFGEGPGTRANFKVHSLESDSYAAREVQAIVELPKEAEAELRDRRGETFELTGRLVHCDGFMRNLFIAGGTISAASPERSN